MDIVAVLTKVVQEQQEKIETYQKTTEEQRKEIRDQQRIISSLSDKMVKIEEGLKKY